MKKRTLVCLVVSMLLLVWASGAAARSVKDQYKKVGIGVRGGIDEKKGETIVDTASKEIIFWEYDGTSIFGGDFTAFLSESLSFQLSVDYMKTDVLISGIVFEDYEQFKGTLTMVPILATARFHPQKIWGFMPYAGGGGGFYYNKWESEAPIFGDMKVEHGFGLHVVGGVEYILAEHHGFILEGRYAWTSYDLKDKPVQNEASATEENINADGWSATFGYRYYFW